MHSCMVHDAWTLQEFDSTSDTNYIQTMNDMVFFIEMLIVYSCQHKSETIQNC